MSFKINSTGRIKLLREFISIKMGPEIGGVPTFAAEIRIPKNTGLALNAKVYVEPYVKSSTMRFDFGTVGSICSPEPCILTEVDAGANVLFRVKIVDESAEHGRILASANGIRPDCDSSGAARKSLLPVRSMNIGECLWRLDIDGEGGPELLVNNKIAGVLDRLKSDSGWQAAIYPEVVRQIAFFIFLRKEEISDDSEWAHDWMLFFERLIGREIGMEESDDPSGGDHLVIQIVERFALQQRYITKIATIET
jgi:hypothetical protein